MNHMFTLKNLAGFFLSAVAAAIIFAAGPASAVEKGRQGEEHLLDTYHRNKARLETNSFGLPLVVESFERDDRVHVDVYGIFDYPFASVVNSLKVPANWCDIVFLHPNIKACTYRALQDSWLLTFYPGSKEYHAPEEKRHRVAAQQQGYLDIFLTADEGPFGTKDHRMRFEALTLNGKKTSSTSAMPTATVQCFASRPRSILRHSVGTRSDSP